MNTRETWFQGIVAVHTDVVGMQSANLLEALINLNDFNRIIVPFVTRLEQHLKRSIQIVGGFLANRVVQEYEKLIPAHIANHARNMMSCVFVRLRQNEVDLVPNARHVCDDIHCIYIPT